MIRNTQIRRIKEQNSENKRCEILISLIRDQLEPYNFDLSDQISNCYINQVIVAKGNFILVQALIIPKSGVFEGIQFRPNIYYRTDNFSLAPKIFNNRKIFHPNINVFTNEIALPEILNWNPATSHLTLLRRLKFVLIEPNSSCIPNNPINKRAAFLYIFNRENFRMAVMDNCPSYLERCTNSENGQIPNSSAMDQEGESSCDQYVDIKTIIPAQRSSTQISESESDELELDLLSKKLRVLNFEEGFQKNQMKYH